MPVLRLLALASIAALLAACPANDSDAQGEDAPGRTVSVQGVGTVSAVPDLALIVASVVTRETTAGVALEANNAEMASAYSTIAEFGIEDRDLRTTSVRLQAQYDRRREAGEPLRIIGYEARNQINIRVRDLDSVGELLDAIVGAGINEISGPSFTIDDPSELMNEARVKAIEDAMARARLYVETAGGSLGQVISISEGGGYVPAVERMTMMDSSGTSAVPISPGEQDVSVSISVVFEIE